MFTLTSYISQVSCTQPHYRTRSVKDTEMCWIPYESIAQKYHMAVYGATGCPCASIHAPCTYEIIRLQHQLSHLSSDMKKERGLPASKMD